MDVVTIAHGQPSAALHRLLAHPASPSSYLRLRPPHVTYAPRWLNPNLTPARYVALLLFLFPYFPDFAVL